MKYDVEMGDLGDEIAVGWCRRSHRWYVLPVVCDPYDVLPQALVPSVVLADTAKLVIVGTLTAAVEVRSSGLTPVHLGEIRHLSHRTNLVFIRYDPLGCRYDLTERKLPIGEIYIGDRVYSVRVCPTTVNYYWGYLPRKLPNGVSSGKWEMYVGGDCPDMVDVWCFSVQSVRTCPQGVTVRVPD